MLLPFVQTETASLAVLSSGRPRETDNNEQTSGIWSTDRRRREGDRGVRKWRKGMLEGRYRKERLWRVFSMDFNKSFNKIRNKIKYNRTCSAAAAVQRSALELSFRFLK